MSCNVSLVGQIVVGGPGACASSCGGSSGATRILPLGSSTCSGKSYPRSGGTDCAVPVTTSGLVGANWVDLPGSQGVSVETLYLSAGSGVFKLRINSSVPELEASGGTYPTGFSGGETVELTVDGVTFTTTFTAGAQTVEEAAIEINQAAIGAELTHQPASVTSAGELLISGNVAGSGETVTVVTGNATLGLATAASSAGAGEIVDVTGDVLLNFPAAAPATSLEISGTGNVSVFVAGS